MERLTYRDKKGEAHLHCYQMCAYHREDCNTAYEVDRCQRYVAFRKLADYEDAEEQGLLLRLPCKVGDTLYFAHHDRVISSEVLSVKYHVEAENHGIFIRERLTIDVEGISAEIDFCDIGKTVFLTREEAEAKLKEMEGSHE